jgi:hypothetical protein
MFKSDSAVLVHADAGGYKPLNRSGTETADVSAGGLTKCGRSNPGCPHPARSFVVPASRNDHERWRNTMLKKVVYVALLVSDQDKALDFYTNVIGLEKRLDSPTPVGPRFLTVGVKGQDFELVLWPGTPAGAEQGSAVYTIEVEDCQTAF